MKTIFSIVTFLILTSFTMSISAQNKMNSYQNLDSKQQSIVSISALTAIGDIEKLKIRLNNGLDAGLTVNEIKEVLVQLYAYCGFPRSLNGIMALMAVTDERKAKGIHDTEGKIASSVNDPDKYQTGKRTLQTLNWSKKKKHRPVPMLLRQPLILF
jgi:4-carboxymuconolactone decarboxylase